jgi:hypothetical protein
LINIPYWVKDDDSALSPRYPDLTVFCDIVQDAYVVVKTDGGGRGVSFCKSTVPFAANVDGETPPGINLTVNLPDAFESEANRLDRFWVAYILSVFQNRTDTSGPLTRGDSDPNSEPGLGGVNGGGAMGTRAALVIQETNLEYKQACGWTPAHANLIWARAAAHELGHQFGAPDRSVGTGIMSVDLYNAGNVRFCTRDLNIIRADAASPGARARYPVTY